MILVDSNIDPKLMRQDTVGRYLTQESPFCPNSSLRAATYHQVSSAPCSFSAPYGYPSPQSPESESTCSSDAYAPGEGPVLANDCFMPCPVSYADRKDSGYCDEEYSVTTRGNFSEFGFGFSNTLVFGMEESFMPVSGPCGGPIPDLKIEDEDYVQDEAHDDEHGHSIKQEPSSTGDYRGMKDHSQNYDDNNDIKPKMESKPDPMEVYNESSDTDSDDIPPENDDSDLDQSYCPRSAKATRTRRKSNVLGARPRASRVTKTRTPRTPSGQQCKTCKQRFSPAAMGKHVSTVHGETRAYPCVFHWAGCDAVFGAKNEWKRHVQSQHLKLSFWRCTQGVCGHSGRGYQGKKANADFNRKDLFTSHLRRMHYKPSLKNGPKSNQTAWEQESQMKAKVVRGAPCNVSSCPFRGCEQRFEGSKGWDDRMEHIAKHLEEHKDVEIDQGAGGVREWAQSKGLVVKDSNGWRLIDQSAGSEADAEGEDDTV